MAVKKLLKFLWGLIRVVLLLIVLGLGYLTFTEFLPAPVENVPVKGTAGETLSRGQELTILNWNVGYGGLGAESDFFMDGGKGVRAADQRTTEKYLTGMRDAIDEIAPDLILLQEVDENSTRTYGIDETAVFFGAAASATYAKNFSVPFVPYPLPPIGRVESGLYTLSNYTIEAAERQSLPCPFSWPVRIVNLKRCLLVNYLPIQGSDKKLVLIDLHLEAYDNGEGRIAQTRQLASFIRSEYEKGNYVIAGGDFNQIFPGGLEAYPNTHPELWKPVSLEESALPEGFTYAFDLSTPSCRLLNQPYDPSDAANTQYYVIDGFILSPNVRLRSVETLDLGFARSDHNPVLLRVKLELIPGLI